MISAEKKLNEEGYVVVEKITEKDDALSLCDEVFLSIKDCSNDLGCCYQDYIRAVSRWVAPSPVTNPVIKFVNEHLQLFLEQRFGKELVLSKTNIIIKSPYARSPTPCHQDIAYSASNPYEFSCWLALNDVTLNEGPLQVLPNSHHNKIDLAIDFWQPDFVDGIRNSSDWKLNAKSLPLMAGDGALFDSRLWHGSCPHIGDQVRMALVTRWKSSDYRGPDQHIPSINASGFGMWTAGDKTQQYLSKILNVSEDTPLLMLIDQFKNTYSLNDQSKDSLTQLKILHRAHTLHNGGDTQGEVYKNVWKHVIYPTLEREQETIV